MSTPRVVMVLGGGGAKTAAHLGAARALGEAGITPVRWIGTSMGAVMAAALATGEDPDAILRRVLAVRRSDVLVANRMAMFRGIWSRALLKPDPLHTAMARILTARSFGALTVPCTVTAVEVQTGSEIAFGADGEDAPLLEALAASCALPPYFPPVRVNGREFYDGGLRAAVPLRQAEGLACDVVVAIHAGPGFDETGEPVQVPPPLIAATDTAVGWLMAGSVELLRQQWDLTPGRPPLIWLRPVRDRGATFAMERSEQYATAGYDAMRHALEALR